MPSDIFLEDDISADATAGPWNRTQGTALGSFSRRRRFLRGCRFGGWRRGGGAPVRMERGSPLPGLDGQGAPVCRYAYAGPYKDRYACFACRKAFKRRKDDDFPARMRAIGAVGQRAVVRCPDCGGAMHNMGMDFAAPRRSDVRQWRKVELLFAHGVAFGGCGCGPGLRPVALREVGAFLEDTLARSEGERLLERFAGRQRERDRSGRRRGAGIGPRITGRVWGPVFPPRRPPARRRAVELEVVSAFAKPGRKRDGNGRTPV